jgi:hypothetical protein
VLNQIADEVIRNRALRPAVGDLPANTFFANLLSSLIVLGLIVGGFIFVFMLIIGSFQWITSGGDKAANESARTKITSALIGLVILFALFAIVNLVGCFFGINFMSFQIRELNVIGGTNPFCSGAGGCPPTTPTCPGMMPCCVGSSWECMPICPD